MRSPLRAAFEAVALERFPGDWLSLREPYDRTARSRSLARAFVDALPRDALVADLGCGHGANAVYLSGLGRPDLRWLLIDGDSAHLSAARSRLPRSQPLRADLVRWGAVAVVDDCDGLTAAALCDLVSGGWVDRVVRSASRRRLPILMALSVDGRVGLSPAADGDTDILSAFRRDQRRDKGFGPALGSLAPAAILRSMRRYGYRSIAAARSDWRLGPDDAKMLHATIGGIASVSGRQGEAWLARRRDQIDAGQLAVTVGHLDILALPGRARRSAGVDEGSRGVTLL